MTDLLRLAVIMLAIALTPSVYAQGQRGIGLTNVVKMVRADSRQTSFCPLSTPTVSPGASRLWTMRPLPRSDSAY